MPFSINAQTEEDILRTGSQNLEDVSRNVAGLTIQNLGPGQSQVAVRGVSAGQIVRDQPGVKEQVGIYLDESVISLSLFTPDLDLFDLSRVETLRGPQGTLFGSGSIGGTIRYITNQPVLDSNEGIAEASFQVIEGGDVGGHVKGAVNIPLVEGKAAARAVGYYTRYGGFIDALREGGGVDENVNSGDRYGGRLSVRVEPTANLAITPRVIYQKIETGGFNRQEVFNLFANPFTTTRPAVQLGEREQFLLLDEAFEDEFLLTDIVLEAGLGLVDFTSVTSYTTRDILVSRDASALSGSVSVDLGFPDAAVLLPSNLRDTSTIQQFTQEARFASDYESPLQWLVGAFYSNTDRDYAQRLPTPGYADAADATLGAGTSLAVANGFPDLDSPFNSDLPFSLEQFAIFGEASYDLTDRLQFTGGLRWYDFDETRTIRTGGLFAAGGPQVEDTTSSDGFSPRFLVSYDATDSLTFNAQASRGFRLGGVNDPLNLPLCDPGDLQTFGAFQDFGDETLWNYEVGAKASRGSFFANTAVFYTDIEDLQVTLDAGSCSSRISFNVPSAHTVGWEFELGGEVLPGLELSLSGSVLEAEFDSTVTDSGGNVLGGVEEGNRLASVPDFQISANATYSFPLPQLSPDSEGYIALSFQHVGDRITQPSDQVPGAGVFVSNLPFGGASGLDQTVVDLELDAYNILNLNAGVTYGGVEFIAFINNATDENALLSFDRERGGRARLGFRTNQSRTYGLTARIRF